MITITTAVFTVVVKESDVLLDKHSTVHGLRDGATKSALEFIRSGLQREVDARHEVRKRPKFTFEVHDIEVKEVVIR